MFYHGINHNYLLYQYPVLSPRLTIARQNKKQKADRKHLIEQFGFEPVHFLEVSKDFTVEKCLENCFNFGDIVVVFKHLPLPFLQLSVNEVGIPVIDVRKTDLIFIKDRNLIMMLRELFPSTPIIIPKKIHKIGKNSSIVRWRKGSKSVKINVIR